MLIARLSACGASARLALRSWASPQCLVQLRRGLGTRKQKIFELAKGFRGRSKNCWRLARNSVHRALQHAYKGRRLKRRARRVRRARRARAPTPPGRACTDPAAARARPAGRPPSQAPLGSGGSCRSMRARASTT